MYLPPSESLDVDCVSSVWEESEEWLYNVSEFSTRPQITQTHDSWQRHTDEEESNAVDTLQHNQSGL